MTKEIWKDVVGYEGLYEVSNLGRVKSLVRKWCIKEIIMMGGIDGSGYRSFGLSKNYKSTTKKAHKLVAEAFLGHTPCGLELVVDHINNVKTDNRLSNLQIVTSRENASNYKRGSSKYTGVSYVGQSKRWRSNIYINGTSEYLGLYETELKASNAYQNRLKEYHETGI